ncbi:c-type cytochrome [Flavihumibacter profundi]|jgi:hypothetical protein|uniref:c-type cytochrome n=1 Tax=Flavihumibacter profundi TaxID=2716883 RepID=UPI001CC56390|nr:cytochrome c [Flavihumibacter profundi]MBZ5858687.1 cytochrome c [Flavihumibacter profundi]
MKKILLITGTIILIFSFGSCYYDKAELLYPNINSCDTVTSITYTKVIVPIFQQNCYSCHGGNSPSGVIAMGTYANDKVLATNGKLMGSINHTAGFSAMPQGAAKLSDCNIAKIRKWVQAGSPNN